jgi:hypothetical protein
MIGKEIWGLKMNKELEETIVKAFFEVRIQDRVLFELSSLIYKCVV